MSLVFHGHPLASFCWKVLIALYENGTPFDAEAGRISAIRPSARRSPRLWPVAKMPVLEDEARGRGRSRDQHHHRLSRPPPSGAGPLRARGSGAARDALLWDRIFDNYVQGPMQKIVLDRIGRTGSGPVRRRGGAGAAGDRARHGRGAVAGQALDDGRGFHARRLRGGAGALLCRQGGAARGALAERPRPCSSG